MNRKLRLEKLEQIAEPKLLGGRIAHYDRARDIYIVDGRELTRAELGAERIPLLAILPAKAASVEEWVESITPDSPA
jgi:hypothetical protein